MLVLEKNASLGGAMGVFRVGQLTVEASLHELDGLDDGDPKLPLLELLGPELALVPAAVGRHAACRSSRPRPSDRRDLPAPDPGTADGAAPTLATACG